NSTSYQSQYLPTACLLNRLAAHDCRDRLLELGPLDLLFLQQGPARFGQFVDFAGRLAFLGFPRRSDQSALLQLVQSRIKLSLPKAQNLPADILYLLRYLIPMLGSVRQDGKNQSLQVAAKRHTYLQT